ncbi:spore germination protein [Shouchella clausii]|uniref:Spore germination protein n=1 Tax=Shouchella clausii TaxID=79880 RepID=A0A268S078_SHOCL|nr:spore germination protein [Shouchella clausii]PAD41883.1 spore germination protein [Bacillus sp. 7520-S]PAE92968.1 spore germination protein [Shouchella clausii]PAF25857.1 spore germination protein [Shouchella clausii]
MPKQSKQGRFERKIRKQKRSSAKTLEELLDLCRRSNDFHSFKQADDNPFEIYYFSSIVKSNVIHEQILPVLANKQLKTLVGVKEAIRVEETKIEHQLAKIEQALMRGEVLICLQQAPTEALLVPAEQAETRSINPPEVEFSVVGPKEAFVEPLSTNINLVRKRLPIPDLVITERIVGHLSKTKVAILHIDGITNNQVVQTVTQRIEDIGFDEIIDSSYIAQLISDDSNSIFPQLIDTERPDRVAAMLAEGKVAVIVDGSPHALTGPTSFVEFFSAFEDYFLPWPLASAFRLIRLCAVLFSILSTALYVAVMTYHYEMIPTQLLNTLVSSRSGIPFPPIFEALILEVVIELLREAGARLPNKIGQTIGIVGGIVIGTAAVEAGLTSNILLIIVALTALASFTTPIYQMGNTIRLIRFPFILAAQWLGFLGVAACFALILSHLLVLTSLGQPYLAPIYPLRATDLKDSFFRLPFYKQKKRPVSVRAKKRKRFSSSHDGNHLKKSDIEE